MDRAHHLATFWGWLPAFRTVAEFGSIQKAALVLRLSPSALSRTIRLLEEALGVALFVRTTAGLTLTAEGSELLQGTREAMRRVDDALGTGQATRATWRVGSAGPLHEHLLAIALAPLLRGPTDPTVVIRAVNEDHIVDALLRGEIDVALLIGGPMLEPPSELVIDALPGLALAYYVPPSFDEGLGAESTPVVKLAGVPLAPTDRLLAEVTSPTAAAILAEATGARVLVPVGLALPSFRPLAVASDRLEVAMISRRPVSTTSASWPAPLAATLRDVLGRLTNGEA